MTAITAAGVKGKPLSCTYTTLLYIAFATHTTKQVTFSNISETLSLACSMSEGTCTEDSVANGDSSFLGYLEDYLHPPDDPMTMWLNQSLPNESAAVNTSPSTASAGYPPLNEPDGPHASKPESINDRDDPMLIPDTPSPASRSTSRESPILPLTTRRENTSYCFPASAEGSTTRTHCFYPVPEWDDCKTVLAALISNYEEETDTLTILIVPFYPYNEDSKHGRQWTDPEKWPTAVSAIDEFMGTLHDDQSLFIRLATQQTAKHLCGGGTLPLVLFLNSMMSQQYDHDIEPKGSVDDVEIVFREGT
jgi:hypothetical protein